MGLFKKKPTVDPADFLALRAELQDVRARLDATEQAKAYLEDRLGSLDATTNVLAANASATSVELSEQIDTMLTRLRATEAETDKVDALQHRLVDVEVRQAVPAPMPADVTDLAPRLDAIAERLEQVAELAAAPVTPDDELAARLNHLSSKADSVDGLAAQLEQLAAQTQSTETLNGQLAQLAERVALSSNDARQAKEHVLAVEARIANVSTELANQLSELGSEIDALAAHQSSTAPDTEATAQVSDEMLQALRNGQVRLANEQARYEIAFREDLATLAEQVRHLRGR
jgi:chromosome segregation ATPase